MHAHVSQHQAPCLCVPARLALHGGACGSAHAYACMCAALARAGGQVHMHACMCAVLARAGGQAHMHACICAVLARAGGQAHMHACMCAALARAGSEEHVQAHVPRVAVIVQAARSTCRRMCLKWPSACRPGRAATVAT
eukprot:358052-Chlamydomonas_euryale.AAC.3